MDQMTPAASRDRADSDPLRASRPSSADGSTPWLRVALWAGRGILLLAAVALVVTLLTRPRWTADGFDADGFAISWIPNVTMVVLVVVGLLWHWLFGLSTSPRASWRDGDDIVALTVLGRRRLHLPAACTVRFRIMTNVGTSHGVVLVDRRLRPLVLLDPFSSGLAGRLDRLTDNRHRATAGGIVLEHLLGFAWLLTSVIAVFVLLGLADALTGAAGLG
ncbi:hypothetical protein [Curtobacterium sp. 9128]|uniref:hypothetical protein n=1 Tax=Curtobacterium sp. 9128 TaxID=1793722 RepID=UPI0011AB032A|nr:hypothetical protein [Curtobacterium sp. 9128]